MTRSSLPSASSVPYPAGSDQRGQPAVPVPSVVVDHDQVAGPALEQGLDQLDRLPGGAEAADHHGRPGTDPGYCLPRVIEEFGHSQRPAFSSTTASPWPTPMQIAATPQRSPEVASERASVPRIRVPEAPSGCPIAMAPPCALTISGSMPQARMHARARALVAASTGANPKNCGSPAAAPRPATRASGGRPVMASAAALPSSAADAPSLSGEELPAVTVPPGRNTGFSFASRSSVVSVRMDSSRSRPAPGILTTWLS